MSSIPYQCYKLACQHEEMNPRKRHTMEDCHRIIPKLLEQQNSIFSYFAVYDGHGGRQIVDFLEKSLENNVANELKQTDDADIPERLARAYLITDLQSKKLNITTSGATSVSALMKTDFNEYGSILRRILYIANCGDSRAVLVHKDSDSNASLTEAHFIAKRLSFDHRSEDETEQKRIKDAGGFITRSRVLGILAVTRSFGDHGMKEFVPADPFTSQTDISDIGDYPFLILACDGVWDVLSDQQAADLLLQRYKEVGPYSEAAELLVNTAIEKGSTDNVTAIVIFL